MADDGDDDTPDPKIINMAGHAKGAKTKWPGKCETDAKGGGPKADLLNTRHALTRLKYKFSYNEFINHHLIERNKVVEHLADRSVTMARVEINQTYSFDPDKFMRAAVQSLCWEKSFHPVVQRLSSFEWNKKQLMDGWMMPAFGAPDTDYIRAVGNLWLLAMVRRVKHPGCKFDTVPILEGHQGLGKSKALAIIALDPDWFTDQEFLNSEVRAQMEGMQGRWLVEMSDLEGMTASRANIAKIKAFLSRTNDDARMAYGYFPERHQRQCVLIGSTNDKFYLKDTTGNRRFWPIPCTRIDLDWLGRNIVQLFAEAVYVEDKLPMNPEALELPPNLWPVAEAMQRGRMAPEPWTEVIAEMNLERRRYSSVEIALKLGHTPEQFSRQVWERILVAMHANGYVGPATMRVLGAGSDVKPVRGYKPKEDQREDMEEPEAPPAPREDMEEPEAPPAPQGGSTQSGGSPPPDDDTPF